MPLEISSIKNEPSAKVLQSRVAEIIAAINLMADSKHHGHLAKHVPALYSPLSDRSRKFLELVAGLPYQGMELLELLLDNRIFNDTDAFTNSILQYDNLHFVYIFAGEEISVERLDEIIHSGEHIEKYLKEFSWFYRGSRDVHEYLLFKTDEFKADLVSLIREVDGEYFDSIVIKLDENYSKTLSDLTNRIRKASPIVIGEEIMNKKIIDDSDVQEYLFIPSFFVGPHYIMAYSKQARLFLCNIMQGNVANIERRKELSAALKILSDDTRIEILRLLILQPVYGKLLADRLNLTTATISHHLSLLISAGLISESRDGMIKYYSVNEDAIDRLIGKLKDYLYNR